MNKIPKSFEVYMGREWAEEFKFVEHRARGFMVLQLPDNRTRELGFAVKKVKVTIEEV